LSHSLKQTSTVSIIIPLYNKAVYVSETIESVLAQSYSNWELIIVDNGSTDNGLTIAQQFNDPRIQTLNCYQKGPGAARNYGLSHAQGDWIQFLDADDLLEPRHIEQQLKVAQQNSEAAIVACSWQEFTDVNPQVKTLKRPAGFQKDISALRDAAIAYAPWAVHAALIKRSALTSNFLWPEELDKYLAEDITFWFKLLSQYKVGYGQSCGCLYRIETIQCRNQNRNPEKWFEGVHAALKANQIYWRQEKGGFTSGQCEALMRVYSSLYLLASEHNSSIIKQRSLACAEYWLKVYFQLVQKPSFAMRVRYLVGLSFFLNFIGRLR
jgi:Glycosyl transferase family 2